MAILQFGATFRNANVGFALQNTSTSNVMVPALGLNIPGLGTKFVHLDVFDNYVRNPRHVQVYDTLTTGKPFKDDFVDLCKLIQVGTLVIRNTSYNAATNVFTAGSVPTSSPLLSASGSSVFFA